jgi:uncharacterized alkaline shock family protein YloU
MTRFLHKLSGAVIWFLFAAMGGALIYANGLRVEDGVLGLFYVQEKWLVLMGAGALMVLIALLYLVTFGPRNPKMRYITFESGEGSVSISVNAVRDYIRKLSGEFSAVVDIDPRITAEKDRIRMDLNVDLVAGVRIPELSAALQNRVRESLREGLGITDIAEIKVRVQEISGEPALPDRE